MVLRATKEGQANAGEAAGKGCQCCASWRHAWQLSGPTIPASTAARRQAALHCRCLSVDCSATYLMANSWGPRCMLKEMGLLFKEASSLISICFKPRHSYSTPTIPIWQLYTVDGLLSTSPSPHQAPCIWSFGHSVGMVACLSIGTSCCKPTDGADQGVVRSVLTYLLLAFQAPAHLLQRSRGQQSSPLVMAARRRGIRASGNTRIVHQRSKQPWRWTQQHQAVNCRRNLYCL